VAQRGRPDRVAEQQQPAHPREPTRTGRDRNV
jgi:hypothetical protein